MIKNSTYLSDFKNDIETGVRFIFSEPMAFEQCHESYVRPEYMQHSFHEHAIPFGKEPFMNKKSEPDTATIDQELIVGLLAELHDLFPLFQDGIINDDSFVGGLPMSYLNADGSLEALTLEESRQIKHALIESNSHAHRTFGLSFKSLLNWIPFFKRHDEESPADNSSEQSIQAVISLDGHLLPLSENKSLSNLVEDQLNTHGLLNLSSYWYAIKEKLEEKKREETNGDLVLIDTNRRKLNAKRLNATPFEQAAQKYSAHISSRFCDANGDILSPESLEAFTNQLIDTLLNITKTYWPFAPLLSLFDAIVIPVLRPMLFPSQTWASEHGFLSEEGAYDVGRLANKRTSLETMPSWNDSARQQALQFVEDALNRHLSSRFLRLRIFDVFSPYNREIHHSEHVDPSGFKGKIKSFGPPVHTEDVMKLIQPASNKTEDKLLEKIMTYRSTEEGIWH